MRALLPLALSALLALGACAQDGKTEKSNPNKMDLNTVTDPTVKAALEAWQAGDAAAWLSHFTADAKFTDDGNARDFKKFVKDACGHERFTSIDKVENGGKDITGAFHTEQWGDFIVFFKFHKNSAGQFDGLDIGQVH
ncbi:MAG: hypothetical protein LKM36_08985 [Flavobacteriales bacterium]|jgi:hypothetical protein|nr:hypothetical protein [Flavobacteriales bacterium]